MLSFTFEPRLSHCIFSSVTTLTCYTTADTVYHVCHKIFTMTRRRN